ncbi:MAG: hypothetical protein K6G71_09545 [Clostridiales bacterium]|nr:hypothetical protein [Clostridiales bacterium]
MTLRKIDPIPKFDRAVWIAVRVALLAFSIHGMLRNSVTEYLMGLFSIAFSHLWDLFQLLGGRSFMTRLSHTSQTMLNIFIIFGCIVVPYFNKYTNILWLNSIEHFASGFLATWFAYDFAMCMQGKKRHLSPALATMFALFFSMALSLAWEFYEFTMDRVYGYTLQKSVLLSEVGLVDTMSDLIFCTVGSLIGMFITAFWHAGIIGPDRKNRRPKEIERMKRDKQEELDFLAAEASAERN